MSQSETPETNAQGFTVLRLGQEIQAVPANFARELERQRDAAQEKLSTVYQWIERHHQDGFTDSMTYWQNLEKIGDKYSDRIDKAERQRDTAREDAARLAQVVKALQIYANDEEGGNYAAKALAAHEAINHKTERL